MPTSTTYWLCATRRKCRCGTARTWHCSSVMVISQSIPMLPCVPRNLYRMLVCCIRSPVFSKHVVCFNCKREMPGLLQTEHSSFVRHAAKTSPSGLVRTHFCFVRLAKVLTEYDRSCLSVASRLPFT